ANPPLELVAGPDVTPELARLANDALAEICVRHADYFPAFVAARAHEQYRRGDRGGGSCRCQSGRARRADLHPCRGSTAEPGGIPPVLPAHGRARSAELGASDARARLCRLQERAAVAG